MNPPAVVVQSLSKAISGLAPIPVLRLFLYRFPQSESVATGESGCGKSILLQLLSGQLCEKLVTRAAPLCATQNNKGQLNQQLS